MNPYDVMAPFYDRMNEEIDYGAWADFIEAQFGRYLPKKPELVLDLAAGTGSMTIELAKRGYDMTAVDLSADMLSAAADRIADAGLSGILLLCQDMTAFELYGTVGAVVCCLDSINHLAGAGDLDKCFSLVHNYLDPDGLFLFDVNTPHKFETVYGENDYVLDDEETGSVCCWRNAYDKESGICDFDLTVFTKRADGTYAREDTVQRERCYSKEQLAGALAKAGFELLGAFSDYAFTEAGDADGRWYIAARCKKEI